MKAYIFRTYTGWTVYDGMLSEAIIYAENDQEARQKAIEQAQGKAFSCNRMYDVTID